MLFVNNNKSVLLSDFYIVKENKDAGLKNMIYKENKGIKFKKFYKKGIGAYRCLTH